MTPGRWAMNALNRISVIGIVIGIIAMVAAGPINAAPAGNTATPPGTAAAAVDDAVAEAAAQYVTSFVSVVDRTTGAVLAQTSNANTPVASESIMKLFLAAYYLVQDGGYTNTPQAVKDQLSYMLRYSDDDTATTLFTPNAIPTVASRYGLSNTSNATDDPGHWGAARITAADMTRFLYQASQDPDVGPWLLPVIAQTAPTGTGQDSGFSQAFGLNALTGDHGSKQGWGCDSYWTSSPCVINSVGYTAHAFIAVLQLGDGYPDPMRGTATYAATVIQQATDAVAPVGNLDSVASTEPGDLTVTGWAADPAHPGQPTDVRLVVTGPSGTKEFDGTSTGLSRPDVAAATPSAGGSTGFTAVVQPQGSGSKQVCAFAVTTSQPAQTQPLGCASVMVSAVDGGVDSVGLRDDQFVVSGWALNIDNPGQQVQIQVSDTAASGTRTLTGFTADDESPAVVAAHPGDGANHAFQAVVPILDAGIHTVCASAGPATPQTQNPGTAVNAATITAAAGSDDQELGCRTITVPVDQVTGWLDPIHVQDGKISVSGWAQDPDDPKEHLRIRVYDTTAAGTRMFAGAVADVDRPDFAAVILSDGSDHGYATDIPAPDAVVHNVCVYAITSDAGSDALLGCQTVTEAS
jgi:hypothetical protein